MKRAGSREVNFKKIKFVGICWEYGNILKIVVWLDISRRSKGEEVCVVVGTILDKD